MTKLLDEAIAKVRSLSDQDQDEAAEILLALTSQRKEPIPLDPATVTAVRRGLAEMRHGKFASDEAVGALFSRYR